MRKFPWKYHVERNGILLNVQILSTIEFRLCDKCYNIVEPLGPFNIDFVYGCTRRDALNNLKFCFFNYENAIKNTAPGGLLEE